MKNQFKKYNKFVATAATATLVASAIVPVASAASFSDVAETNSHAANIDALVEAGIIKGYEDGTFRPGTTLTRGQVVKMLGKWVEAQGFEIPANYITEARFTDVAVDAKDQELVKYAALVADTGVFNGSNGALNASGDISRENMALVLDRAYKAVKGSTLVELAAGSEELVVADLATAKAEAQEAIQALRNLGISNVETFAPKSTVTRGQFASFLNRTINVEAPVAVNVEEIVVAAEEAVKALPKTVAATEITVAQASVKTATEAIKAAQDALTADKVLTEEETTALQARIDAATKAVEATQVVIDKAIEDAKELTVEAVTAISATQVEVKFSKAVAKDSVIDANNALIAGKVSITAVNSSTSLNVTPELSKDGKTLTLTTKATIAEGRYVVKVEGVKTATKQELVKFDQVVTFAADTTAPAIKETVKVNASQTKVVFSEPLKTAGAITYTLEDGTAVTGITSSLLNDTITFNLAAAKVGKKT